MATIDTSTELDATAFSNQRKLDGCSNGVLLCMFDGELWYSTDNGATWVEDTGALIAGFTEGSIFVAQDGSTDRLAIVWTQSGSGGSRVTGRSYFVWAVPNAGRTAWTLGTPRELSTDVTGGRMDVVAFKNGTGWEAAIVRSDNGNEPEYTRISINSSDAITGSSRDGLTASSGDFGRLSSIKVTSYPSIDFNHTGDGKTVAGATPHIYCGWSEGTGDGVKFRKAVFSGGTWTFNAIRDIDTGRYLANVGIEWLNCLFDGTRVILAGQLSDSTNRDLMLYERDAADTTTTTRELSANVSTANRLDYGSMSYDSLGNVYLIGQEVASASGSRDLNVRRWTRATTTLEAIVVLDSTTGLTPYAAARRGYAESRIDVVFTDYTASSPYNVVYLTAVVLNTAPTAPVITAPNGGETIDASVDVTWTQATDAEQAQATLQYHLQYSDNNGGSWADIVALTSAGVGTYSWNTAALPSGSAYKVRARAWDGTVFGPYDESNAVFTIQHNVAPTAPTWDSPTGGSTVDRAAAQVFDWTFNDPNAGDYQTKFDWEYRPSSGGSWTVVTVGPGGAGLTSAHTLAGGTLAAGSWEFRVRTYDSLGVVSPYSSTLTLIFATAPVAPVFVDPLNGGTIGLTEYVAEWTTIEQGQGYEMRRVADAAGSPDLGTIYWTYASANSTDRDHVVPFETNNRFEHLQIRTKDDGLWSTWISVRVNVSYTAPPAPTLAYAGIPGENALQVTITNPAPGGGEPAATSNDLYRRVVGDSSDGELVRNGETLVPNAVFTDRMISHRSNYEYRVLVHGDNGTSRFGAWV